MASLYLDWNSWPAEMFRGGVAAIGNFDGVHRGHAYLLSQARTLAQSLACPLIAVTFHPHPLAILNPPAYQPPLTSPQERAELLQRFGADHVLILKTSPELLALGPTAFFEDLLEKSLKIRGLVEGFNFRFGHNREGSNVDLREFCEARRIPFVEVSAFGLGGITVSSSLVRKALVVGDVSQATELLGHRYTISGEVVTGARRGRTIGFPTANLGPIPNLLPAEGVYAVRATVRGQTFRGAANIGPNPTFGENARKIEIFLIDFQADIYGETFRAEFVQRIRETRKFDSREDLIAQMTADIALAGKIE